MKSSRDTINRRLADFETAHGDELAALTRLSGPLLKACQLVQASWSGSFIGWHGKMYYQHFATPDVDSQFNGEWGAIRGMPDGWSARTPDEVAHHISKLMSPDFEAEGYEDSLKMVRSSLQDAVADVGVAMVGVVVPDSPKAKQYAAAVEGAEIPERKLANIQQRLPKSSMSRDTEALRQGTILPPWLYWESVAIEAEATGKWYEEYKKSVRRLFDVLEMIAPTNTPMLALPTFALHPEIISKCGSLYDTQSYAEAVEKSFKVVRDRLRQLTSYERGSEAFGKGKLHIKGAAATNVDSDFNEGVKFLSMAIDMFRNEKAHTSDARIDDPARAYQYLVVSSLALYFLDQGEIV